jgi:hypothetical protein
MCEVDHGIPLFVVVLSMRFKVAVRNLQRVDLIGWKGRMQPGLNLDAACTCCT